MISVRKMLAWLMLAFCIISMCNFAYAKQNCAFKVDLKITNDFGTETTEFNVGDTVNIDVILKETSESDYLMYAAQFEVLFDSSCAELTSATPNASDFHVGTRSNKAIFAYLSLDNSGVKRTAELLVGRVQLKATKNATLQISCENAKVTNQDTSLRTLEVGTAKTVKIGSGIALVDRQTLKAQIDIANDTKSNVSVSTNGSNIAKSAKWVTQSELDAIEDALSSAVRVYNSADAAQSEIESVTSTLEAANGVFKSALKDGRKSFSGGTSGGSGSSGGTSGGTSGGSGSSGAIGGGGIVGGIGGVINHTVSFQTNGGSAVASVTVRNNGTLSQINKPVKSGFLFETWYMDSSLTNRFDITEPITQDITLYAKWTAISGNGTDGVNRDAGTGPFIDVKTYDWFYDYVSYAFENGLMNGMAGGRFAPNANITRAMFVTVLYRIENEPQTGSAGFTDVKSGSYYQNAVNWCATNQIVNGVTKTEFAPNRNITREQMATIAYRYAKFKGIDLSNNAEISYKDTKNISDYAREAVIWAKSKEIMLGSQDNAFVPKGNSTRAEAAAVFQRIISNLK